MQVVCGACGARYTIADEKIPIQGARVRCRKCQAVFSIERGAAPPAPSELPLIPPTPQAADPAPPAAPSTPSGAGAFETPASQAGDEAQVAPTEIERFATAFASSPPVEAQPNPFMQAPAPSAPAPSAPTPAAAAPPAPGPQPAGPGRETASAPATPASRFSPSGGVPEGLPEAERLKHERARRLARVLASDIAIYNKEKRDRGIQEGNLVAVLGYEIKKSWEVYKERVTPEMANSTPYFRDALNEMLAEGKKVF